MISNKKYIYTEDSPIEKFKNITQIIFNIFLKKQGFILILIFFISLILYFRYSNESIIVSNNLLNKILIPNLYNSCYKDISLALLTSSIFYFFTSYLPYKLRRKKYFLEIERRLFDVHQNLSLILSILIDNMDSYKLLEEEKYEEFEKHLLKWTDIRQTVPFNIPLYEAIKPEKKKLKEKINKLLKYSEYLEPELKDILENISYCHLYRASSFDPTPVVLNGYVITPASNSIKFFDVSDLYEILKNLKEFCRKNKRIEEIFLISLRKEKQFTKYEKISLKVFNRNPAFSSYFNLADFAYKERKFKKFVKYLFRFLKSKQLKQQPRNGKLGIFHQIETSYPEILSNKKYLKIRYILLAAPEIEREVITLVQDKEVKTFSRYKEICSKYSSL